MEKAVECLINRPLKTDWLSLLHTLAYHASSSLLSHLLLLFLTIAPLFLLSNCLCFFLYGIFLDFCECDDLDVTEAETRFHPLSNLASVWLSTCLSVTVSPCICSVCVLSVQKIPLCCITLYYLILTAFPVQMLYVFVDIQTGLYTFLFPLYASMPICIRVEPCVTQSFLQLLAPGARDFVFIYMYEPQGTWKGPFHPQTPARRCTAQQKTHYTINQG